MGREGGGGLVLVAVFVLAVLGSVAAIAMSAQATEAHRTRITERSLAQAREALLAHAAERPISREVGPGHLPCPDADDDGWAEPTCGSLSGHLGQAERLGRLPWKTLGLPDLRDGHGERLWYAVSTRYKGLLNCAASAECRALTPGTGLGTLTVRASTGTVIHDGTIGDAGRAADGGAAAVVIAPGPPLTRLDGRVQTRPCAARCDAADYLDLAPPSAGGEDNATFQDRSDLRTGNADGFVQGPVASPAGGLAVNDRIAAIGYSDLMPRVMARVALELAHCVAQAPVLPAAAPGCTASFAGRIDADALAGAACHARAEQPAWWPAWREHVLFVPAGPGGLEVRDAAGRQVAAARRLAVLATQRPGECLDGLVTCGAAGCTAVTTRPRTRALHDAIVSIR